MSLLVPRYRPLLSRRPAAAAGYVAPPITSGLVLDARSHLGTWQDAAKTTLAAADTDPVGAWVDGSGAAHDLLTVSAGTTRPLLKLAQVNGKPSIRFDGSNDLLKALFTLTNFDLFCIVRQIAWTSGRCLFTGGTVDNFSLAQGPTASPNVQCWNGSANSGTQTGLTVGTWFHLQVQFPAAGALSTKVNAAAAVTGSSSPSATRGGICVASHNNNTSFASVEYAAILVYNTALSSGDATLVRNALNSIYAVF